MEDVERLDRASRDGRCAIGDRIRNAAKGGVSDWSRRVGRGLLHIWPQIAVNAVDRASADPFRPKGNAGKRGCFLQQPAKPVSILPRLGCGKTQVDILSRRESERRLLDDAKNSCASGFCAIAGAEYGEIEENLQRIT
jgi:hypothetical protein